MFGLVYSPWERVTTSHHGSQVFVFLLLTGTVLFLVSLLSPIMLLRTSIRFIYSLKLTDTAPRAPITKGTTMTFRMRRTFKSWYFSNFSSSLSFTLSSPWMATLTMTTSLSFLQCLVFLPQFSDHGIMPSFIFCLRQLTALTHHMGHRFSLTSANSAHRGILLCDQYEISYNLFSKLVPGRYISEPQYIL